jgi:hypothetical protein
MAEMNFVEWLKTHWFILVALLAAGTAWGQSINKISNLEQRLAQSEMIIQNQGRLDERTLMMQKQIEEQNKVLIEILTTQRIWAERNRIVIPLDAKAPTQ